MTRCRGQLIYLTTFFDLLLGAQIVRNRTDDLNRTNYDDN